MKIVKILGGLGNQMFQYAFFLSLKKKFPTEEIYVDLSSFKSYNLHNGLELGSVFELELPQAKVGHLLKVTYPIKNYTFSRIIRKIFPKLSTEYVEPYDHKIDVSIFTDNGNKYYDGYWQNYFYFKDVEDLVRSKFSFKQPLIGINLENFKSIRDNDKSVSIHVRRGDYLKSKYYRGICDIEYYSASIKYIIDNVNNPVFYVFSNDISWCREHFKPFIIKANFIFINNNKGAYSYIDMQLMAACRINIIANSSFSWWAAWLNPHFNKLVIAPKKWINADVKCIYQMPDWKLI
jgi:hypothetical protein